MKLFYIQFNMNKNTMEMELKYAEREGSILKYEDKTFILSDKVFKNTFSEQFCNFLYEKYKRCSMLKWNLEEYNEYIELYENDTLYLLFINFAKQKDVSIMYEIALISKEAMVGYV